jgi:uncharacterized membrane protein YdbT with pleckstrin-like domain
MPTLHKHWVILVRPFVIPGLLLVAVAVLLNVLAPAALALEARTIATVALLVAALLCALVAWLVRQSSSLTVTTQRVIEEEGILRRTSNVIPADRIQDISIKQTITGRLLGYGDIEIDTAGAAKEVFTYLPGPEKLRDQIFIVSEERRRPSGPGDGT